MNTDSTPTSQGKSFIPLTLISLSVIFFFSWQLSSISTARGNLMNSGKQVDDFANANLQKYSDAVGKAAQVEDALKKLAGDVLDLSKTDAGAKQVVEHLEAVGIKFQAPPAGQAPAPSATQP